jgi:hypothetical protein
LYSHLFGTVARWLAAPDADRDPLVDWLLGSARGRGSLAVTLLLAAGLHRDVLAGHEDAASLARYFPTTGGDLPPGDAKFEVTLRETIMARAGVLGPFIQKAKVQTNETGRGLCWLLPLLQTGWSSVHLVDLGASAGLNLVADLRAYRLLDLEDQNAVLDIGCGDPVQFETGFRDQVGLVDRLRDSRLPVVESRTGCDAEPFPLQTAEDELTLRSFIWGDQLARMERLREGIEAYRKALESPAPVRVYRCDLPQGLGSFLDRRVPTSPLSPVVIYNTYMTTYLEDKGKSMVDEIGRWAAGQGQPILWLQWEPVRDGRVPPVDDWISWTADLWDAQGHRRWQLGWVHPHGSEAMLERGLGTGRTL